MNSTHKFSAVFRMFDSTGVGVSFGVGDDNLGDFNAELERLRDGLNLRGYTPQPVDAVIGSKVDRCTGWVLGQKRDGSPCVWLYGPEHLNFKLITVWSEDFERLPFDPGASGAMWPTGQAPERESVSPLPEFWNPTEFEIVLSPHEFKTKDNGEPMLVFGGVRGFSTGKPESLETVGPELNPSGDEKTPENGAQQAESNPDFVSNTFNGKRIDEGLLSLDDLGPRPRWPSSKAAQLWAIGIGACANEYEAENAWDKWVEKVTGERLDDADIMTAFKSQIADLFYRRQMTKLADPANQTPKF